MLRILALCVISLSASAQPANFTDHATRPVLPVISAQNGTGAPWDLVNNPALLCRPSQSWLGGFASIPLSDEQRSLPTGGGVYIAPERNCRTHRLLKIRLPVLGIGVTHLVPSSLQVGMPGEATQFTLALAYGSERFHLGFSYHRFFGDTVLSGVDTTDFGIGMRLSNHFAIAGVVRDLNAPSVGGSSLQRRYGAELLARPFGNDRLYMTIGGHLGERRGDFDVQSLINWQVATGLALYAQTGYEKRLGVDTMGGFESERVWRGGVGITIQPGLVFGKIHTSVTGRYGDKLNIPSMNVAVEVGDYPRVWGRRDYIESLTIKSGSVETLVALVGRMADRARDPKLKGLHIRVRGIPGGKAGAYTLRNSIKMLRSSGKKVLVHLDYGSLWTYWLAAAADEVHLDPAGGLRLAGMGATVFFLKDAFQHVGIAAQFEKIDEYKATPETFTQNQPSTPATEMRNALLDDSYRIVLESLASDRGLSAKKVKALIDQSLFDPSQALRAGLVDKLTMEDKMAQALGKTTGVSRQRGDARATSGRWFPSKVAVVKIVGDIAGGKSRKIPLLGRSVAGAESIAASLSQALVDPRIKAIVIYVDSPGGGVFASEQIARAVAKAAKSKPTVCVMGDVAASGGYYSVANCQRVFASPMTITGSIGIFTGKFDLSALMKKLGVGWKEYERGKRASMDSMLRPYTDAERKALHENIEYHYQQFLQVVANGRGMTPKGVNRIGRGRIWSGKKALQIGLVDELGGVDRAIAYAAGKAGLSHGQYRVEFFPKRRVGILDALGVSLVEGQHILSSLTEWIPASMIAEPHQLQARLPWVAPQP